MSSRKIYVLIICIFLFVNQINWTDGSVLDWIWPDRNVGNFRTDIDYSSSALPAVPFELNENNDRFIMDISKALGLRLSDLDFCQQRVVLSLKISCNSLTDEELGKLAISLLNCQHIAEARQTVECSINVPLRDCVRQMSDDTKISYGQILNRAKTVCLAIRQDQFKGMAEITINKLMAQVDRLRTSQNQLERATLGSIDEITDNQLKLLDRQNELLKLTDVQKITVETNLKDILREKNAIRTGQIELASFIGNLKSKIEEGLHELHGQNSETKEVFKDLYVDLSNLNKISDKISLRLEEVSQNAFEKNKETSEQFESTILKLKDANDIVQNLSQTLNAMRADFYGKIQWMEQYLGTGDDLAHRSNVIFVHILYLLVGMICLLFINADPISRFMLLGAIAINLMAVLNEYIKLDLMLLTETIFVLLFANFVTKHLLKYCNFKKLKDLVTVNERVTSTANERVIPVIVEKNGYVNSENNHNNNNYANKKEEIYRDTTKTSYATYTNGLRPDLRRLSAMIDHNSNYSDRSRSSTPVPLTQSSINGMGRCKAITKSGTRCQLMTASSYIDFCRIHERSSASRER